MKYILILLGICVLISGILLGVWLGGIEQQIYEKVSPYSHLRSYDVDYNNYIAISVSIGGLINSFIFFGIAKILFVLDSIRNSENKPKSILDSIEKSLKENSNGNY